MDHSDFTRGNVDTSKIRVLEIQQFQSNLRNFACCSEIASMPKFFKKYMLILQCLSSIPPNVQALTTKIHRERIFSKENQTRTLFLHEVFKFKKFIINQFLCFRPKNLIESTLDTKESKNIFFEKFWQHDGVISLRDAKIMLLLKFCLCELE